MDQRTEEAITKSEKINIEITPETLVLAFMESLYFNENVEAVRIHLARIGDEIPTHKVRISCSGRGKVKGKIVSGVFHGRIYGTENQINAWIEFFNTFVAVPEFSFTKYVQWLKKDKKLTGEL